MRRERPRLEPVARAARSGVRDLRLSVDPPPRAHGRMSEKELERHSAERARGGAGDRIRTGDILLGKQTLCQLSYSRSGGAGTKPVRGGMYHPDDDAAAPIEPGLTPSAEPRRPDCLHPASTSGFTSPMTRSIVSVVVWRRQRDASDDPAPTLSGVQQGRRQGLRYTVMVMSGRAERARSSSAPGCAEGGTIARVPGASGRARGDHRSGGRGFPLDIRGLSGRIGAGARRQARCLPGRHPAPTAVRGERLGLRRVTGADARWGEQPSRRAGRGRRVEVVVDVRYR